MDDADAAAARTTLERRDFATRAAFVTWVAGRSPAVGLVMRAANAAYRYTGTGTAIADLAGWVPNGTAPASGGGTSTYLRADGTWAPALANGVEWGGMTGKPTTLGAGQWLCGVGQLRQGAHSATARDQVVQRGLC